MVGPKNSAEEKRVATGDFEFRLEDSVTMLPANELFSDGKLVTLQLPSSCSKQPPQPWNAMRSPDHCLLSPKAPGCSSSWRKILGLKRFSHNRKTTSSMSSSSLFPSDKRSSYSCLPQLLHRRSRSSSDSSSDASSLSLPLLKDSECESLPISSLDLSLSSSSSGHEHEDIPKLSVDAERPNHQNMNLILDLSPNPFAPARSLYPNPPPMRMMKPQEINHAATGNRIVRRSTEETSRKAMRRGVSVDSPRLNSSGKVVFQNLERSSSSPSSFNGGTCRYRHRSSMERSYRTNVRVTPVLNVLVCSHRGRSKSGIFSHFFTSSSSSSSSSVSSPHNHHRNGGNIKESSHHHHHNYHHHHGTVFLNTL